jgi:peptide/nickel transport system permease protein
VIGLARDQSAVLGLIAICGTILMAVLAPALAPADPIKNSLVERLTPPMWSAGGSVKHPLGTDTLGRDVASRLLYGARVSLIVGLAAVVVAGVIGVALGLLSATTEAGRTTR